MKYPIRNNALVIVKPEIVGLHPQNYPFNNEEPIIFIGEIPNMLEHGIFATKDGKLHFGYHIDDFEEYVDKDVGSGQKLCKSCAGKGVVFEEVDGELKMHHCERCDGHGILIDEKVE